MYWKKGLLGGINGLVKDGDRGHALYLIIVMFKMVTGERKTSADYQNAMTSLYT